MAYHGHMLEARLFLLLLKPSWPSLFLVIVIASVIIGVANWAYVMASLPFYDFFYGQQGIVTVYEQSPNMTDSFWVTITASPAAYVVGIVSAALGMAAIVFVTLRLIERGFGAMHTAIIEEPFERHEQLRRNLTRGAVCLLWVVYWLVFLNVVAPFCLLLSRIATENLNEWSGIVIWVSSMLLLIAALHMHVIFLRLVALRPRLFGGEADIEAVLLASAKNCVN